ncbi:helix-turn-helix domain-containing protein [Jiella marina]|uniref:helix-turn-helix domain-containing protein n=1 Tax=Jiella sp. LLJ827 TaxID=2917712 RepID=UPI002101387E|nr:helix-turn-helix transcriptional regulator [Jiella sp. LLJ827]MCQ0990346.1 helix-turn-helix domain-containing protein [Jiella sp. LLJ827]
MLNAEKIRAARGFLDWSQAELAEKAGLAKSTVANLEAERGEPDARTLRRIETCFSEQGIFITPSGVEKRDFVLTTYDDYLEVLADVEHTVPPGGEVLFHCADDRRSSAAVSQKLQDMRKAGYRFRSTICAGNTVIAGDLADYRWIPEDYFSGSEICVIYGDKTMQHVPGTAGNNFVVMKSAVHAKVMRRQFEYWWRNGQMVGGGDVSD